MYVYEEGVLCDLRNENITQKVFNACPFVLNKHYCVITKFDQFIDTIEKL